MTFLVSGAISIKCHRPANSDPHAWPGGAGGWMPTMGQQGKRAGGADVSKHKKMTGRVEVVKPKATMLLDWPRKRQPCLFRVSHPPSLPELYKESWSLQTSAFFLPVDIFRTDALGKSCHWSVWNPDQGRIWTECGLNGPARVSWGLIALLSTEPVLSRGTEARAEGWKTYQNQPITWSWLNVD